MKYKISDYIADFLDAQKIDYVFEVAGGMITHILDSLYQKQKVNIISVHHEQAAAFAAEAFGRVTGKPGVALATSGPGATNLITGIASCYFDSCPGIFITGQVNTHEQKGVKQVRQLGFQETDIVSMVLPITKWAVQVENAEDLPGILEKAYRMSTGDRPGPVLIDIPMNIQRVEIECTPPRKLDKLPGSFQSTKNIDLLFQALKTAKRPLILAGRGINAAQVREPLLEFAERFNIPIVTSLLAVDVIPYDHPLRVGFIGSYGNRWANLALGECDLLIVLGSRLDIRQTGADTKSFGAGKTIIHVDCDESEINNRLPNCIPIVSDLQSFFDHIKDQHSIGTGFHEWSEYISLLKNKWSDLIELKNVKGINPNKFMHAVSQASKESIGYSVDVGAHQMWAAQSTEIVKNQFFITSAGMGAMGYALPAAIGLSLACEKKPVVVIVGDGCLQMNIQELQTVIRNKLPIKIIVLNNQSLGMIRQFQDSYFDSRYQSTYWGYSAPNFEVVAEAYGIQAKTISQENEITQALDWLWADKDQPSLLQVMIEPSLHVYPKIAFGRRITDMEPFAKPIEMEGT